VAWWDGKESVVFAHDTIYTPNWTDYWTKPLYAAPVQEDWYGQHQWQCGYERGWDAAIERKREWVGLTKAEIDKIYYEYGESAGYEYEQAIEAKLKEKNT
jgi:hypothetical protein